MQNSSFYNATPEPPKYNRMLHTPNNCDLSPVGYPPKEQKQHFSESLWEEETRYTPLNPPSNHTSVLFSLNKKLHEKSYELQQISSVNTSFESILGKYSSSVSQEELLQENSELKKEITDYMNQEFEKLQELDCEQFELQKKYSELLAQIEQERELQTLNLEKHKSLVSQEHQKNIELKQFIEEKAELISEKENMYINYEKSLFEREAKLTAEQKQLEERKQTVQIIELPEVPLLNFPLVVLCVSLLFGFAMQYKLNILTLT